ncbi:hypothetical protein DFP73DRAFT_598364 [Morchella snyderi]|nr:hypothetical protein DFP73DRAFT_598364 [Morchella snyderi]
MPTSEPTTPSSSDRSSSTSTPTSLGTISPTTADTSPSSSPNSTAPSTSRQPSPSSHDLIVSLLHSAQSAQSVVVSTALATNNPARVRQRGARETGRPVHDAVAYGYLDDPTVVNARAAAKAKGARDKMEFEERLFRRMTMPVSMGTLGTLKDTLRLSGLEGHEEEGHEDEEDEQEPEERVLGELNDFQGK